ncbi:MAG: ATP-binding cassette domain-containing protein [Kiritimatiellae bacterium]|nr:ATP-binding cassette domain-containing protein [Kiritimatiellia bacterium]
MSTTAPEPVAARPPEPAPPADDVVLSARAVSKKFCKSLRRSMAYGLWDLAADLVGVRKETARLRKDEFWAVDKVDLQLRRGESCGLIGMNGSGKTTLLRLLAGIFPPDHGEIRIRGRVGALIALGAGFHPHMTGRENIYLNGAILGMHCEELDAKFESIVEFSEIADFIDTPVAAYSSGMRVRLGFAIAAKTDPQVLLVDEVIAVGDVGFRMKCYQYVLTLMERGTAVIVVTHNVSQLSRVTDRCMVLSKGRVAFDGDLTTGIGTYDHLVGRAREAEPRPRRREAWIETVRLFDEAGTERYAFETGETVVAEIALQATRDLREARLIAALDSPSVGPLGSVATPYRGFRFDVPPGGTVIRLKLPRLPLLLGGYRLTVNLYGPRITDFYDRLMPAAEFQIVGPPTNAFGFGVNQTFLFEHDWEPRTGTANERE